jgi:hypothetical protein
MEEYKGWTPGAVIHQQAPPSPNAEHSHASGSDSRTPTGGHRYSAANGGVSARGRPNINNGHVPAASSSYEVKSSTPVLSASTNPLSLPPTLPMLSPTTGTPSSPKVNRPITNPSTPQPLPSGSMVTPRTVASLAFQLHPPTPSHHPLSQHHPLHQYGAGSAAAMTAEIASHQ